MDQLHMHFTSAIHNTAFTIVLGYVELASGTGSSNFQKRQYADLCKVSQSFGQKRQYADLWKVSQPFGQK